MDLPPLATALYQSERVNRHEGKTREEREGAGGVAEQRRFDRARGQEGDEVHTQAGHCAAQDEDAVAAVAGLRVELEPEAERAADDVVERVDDAEEQVDHADGVGRPGVDEERVQPQTPEEEGALLERVAGEAPSDPLVVGRNVFRAVHLPDL